MRRALAIVPALAAWSGNGTKAAGMGCGLAGHEMTRVERET